MEPELISNESVELDATKIDTFEKVQKFQSFLFQLDGALEGDSPEYLEKCPLTHKFVDGAYVREIFLPKDTFFVTKIHGKTHPYFVMKGKVKVYIDGNTEIIEAPFAGITMAGTKRVIYTYEDTVWITVHVTNETDIAKIEDEVIIPESKHVLHDLNKVSKGELK